MNHAEEIKNAQEKFSQLLSEQFDRIDRMKAEKDFIDYSKLDTIEIGIVGGDGIGRPSPHRHSVSWSFCSRMKWKRARLPFA